MRAAEFPAKGKLKKKKMEMERRNGKRKRKWQKLISSSSIPLVYIERKTKSKMTIDFGGK